MKNYRVTVNGVAYDVTVEEVGAEEMSAPEPKPQPAAAPPKQKPQKPPKAAAAGGTPLPSPLPGKVVDLKVSVGDTVKRGDVVLILEAMKMENEVAAPQDGKIASLEVSVGDMVESGDVLATMDV